MKHSLLFLSFITAAFGDVETGQLSEALGHMIGKNLQSLDVPLDMARIAKGLQDEVAALEQRLKSARQ